MEGLLTVTLNKKTAEGTYTSSVVNNARQWPADDEVYTEAGLSRLDTQLSVFYLWVAELPALTTVVWGDQVVNDLNETWIVMSSKEICNRTQYRCVARKTQ